MSRPRKPSFSRVASDMETRLAHLEQKLSRPATSRVEPLPFLRFAGTVSIESLGVEGAGTVVWDADNEVYPLPDGFEVTSTVAGAGTALTTVDGIGWFTGTIRYLVAGVPVVAKLGTTGWGPSAEDETGWLAEGNRFSMSFVETPIGVLLPFSAVIGVAVLPDPTTATALMAIRRVVHTDDHVLY